MFTLKFDFIAFNSLNFGSLPFSIISKRREGEILIIEAKASIVKRFWALIFCIRSPKDLIEILLGVENLAIDDLGVGASMPFKEEILLKVIEERSAAGLATHFTINEEGEKNLSRKIKSRLKECSYTSFNKGNDYRVKAMLKRMEGGF